MTRKAILYARFSPRPNAATTESCESQIEDLRAYCKKRGYEIAGEFSDKALSGGDSWDDRPGMFDAANMVKRGDLFLVRAFDRLFRDTQKGLFFASMIEKQGGEIRSITEEAASLKTPEAAFMRTILLAVAEYNRHVSNARTRAAMLRHQRNGRRMSGETPYGMKPDPSDAHRMVKNYEEIATIDSICQAHKEGDSMMAIARLLNDRQIFNRAGKPWHHQQIQRILKRAEVFTTEEADVQF